MSPRLWRRFGAVLASACLVAVGAGVATASAADTPVHRASAVRPDSLLEFIETANIHPTQNSGYCLDSNTNGKGNNVGAVYVIPCNGGDYQKWDIYLDTSDGYYQLVDRATARCLDSNFGASRSPLVSGDAYALPCNGGPYQHWLWSATGVTAGAFAFQDIETTMYLRYNISSHNVDTATYCNCSAMTYYMTHIYT